MKGKKRNATEEGLASQKRKAKEWRDSLTEEEKKKMHDSKRGKPISDEQKAKMSKTFRENFINITKEEHERRYSHNNKPVVVYDLNMNPLYEFESILKCCNYFNDKNIKLNKSHIGAVCNGIRKTHLGFLFRFRTN